MGKYRPHLLALVCLALASLVWLDNRDFISSLWSNGSPASPDAVRSTTDERLPALERPATADKLSPPALGNPLVAVDKNSLSNWVERPLFAPSRRRPPPEVAKAQAAAPKAPPNYTFIGVILNAKKTVAVLRSVSNGANLHVEVGDTLGGWKVDSVDRTAVTLVHESDPAQVIQFKQGCTESSGNCP
ncbi:MULTISPECIES: hypothetical protein [unclassified Hyphomicrobium]|uniref:hypothetical protein n=1 Tax=unclassified Hyphomicrobium TaxID=2619925 RepID=UPI000213D39D|nr:MULTISPECIES: hypothetical protein [unclassified Hyphomicrobium]CCB66234.1 conserved exported protein of unknown function [Hyphomicrobium sp. MC1]